MLNPVQFPTTKLSSLKAVSVESGAIKSDITSVRGFSLLEIVLGMLVLAIVGGGLVSGLASQQRQSSQIWHAIRATELAQSLQSEIFSRSFDENSSRNGSNLRCGETGALACAASIPSCPTSGLTALTEEALRAEYDDVDDYHCLNVDASNLSDLLGDSLASEYAGYRVSVVVSYAGSGLGLSNRRAKRIITTITPPDNNALIFFRIKGNW